LQWATKRKLNAVLEAFGVAVNADRLALFCGDVDGKDVNELLAAGAIKIKDVPSGGGGGGGDAVVAKEAKPEEKEEEMDLGGGMDMFGAEEGGSAVVATTRRLCVTTACAPSYCILQYSPTNAANGNVVRVPCWSLATISKIAALLQIDFATTIHV
jgi:large subunit ribosomal protein LP2